jgi:hypothetical protein
MNKRASNNVTRNVKSSHQVNVEAMNKAKAELDTATLESEQATELEALKTEAKYAEAEAATAEAEATEVGKAEAAKAESATEVSDAEAEAAGTIEKAEELKSEAAEALKTAEVAKTGKRSAEEIAAEMKALQEKRSKLAVEKAEMLKAKQADAEALKAEEELNAMRKELEAEELEAEELKNMSAEDFLKQSKRKELDHDAWESAFAEGNNKLAAEYQDKLFIAALEASGNSVEQIKTVREYWKKQSSNFRAINADDTMKGEKKQKAIMRRTLNRLIESKRVLKEGMKLSINQNWKAEESKTDK